MTNNKEMTDNINIDNQTISLSPDATNKILEIKSKPINQNKFLRVAVEGGGCSGFQYHFTIEDKTTDNDLLFFADDKILAAIDKNFLPFLHNSLIDFSSDLGGSSFVIKNPNATSSCGCGNSFSI